MRALSASAYWHRGRSALFEGRAEEALGYLLCLSEPEHEAAHPTFALLAAAGAVAVCLGVSGLYGVVAYAVSQRRREIGIRLAVGAEPGDVRRLFLRWGLVVSASGMAAGLAAALGLTRLLRSLLFGVDPLDPMTFVVTSCVVALTAATAVYASTRRTSAVDPAQTLRET